MNTINKKQYLIGVSGGPDSIYLLDKYQDEIKVVCHVNYNKRQTALRDQLIVYNYCLRRNIPLEILTISSNHNYHKNFQDQARKIRYDFLLDVAKKFQVDQCLIAHQKDDFLENATMQYEKNQDLLFYGLHKDSKYQSLKLYRPLLDLWKDEILAFLDKHKISYGIDESNFSLVYKRNKIRAELSKLTQEQKQEKLNFFLKLNEQNKARYKNLIQLLSSWNNNYLELINFSEYHNFIYLWLSQNNIKYTKNKADNILSFLKKKNKKLFRLKDGIFLGKENDKLKIIKK
ncbi:tRNA lysidine(34) synthetase TilS [[Mycoplasma] imitans]|uniref:tRNA lysidine(34) synthetase TilS n=1 Tax=[Mycoplasma] imitans TaxID=29560 RepID=UPI0004814EED|nr:tRNA lysidine(34) synthetase TilS [[Mycoplasma] imitans]